MSAKAITFDVWGTILPVEPAIKVVADVLTKALGGRVQWSSIYSFVQDERRALKLARRERQEFIPPTYNLYRIKRKLKERGIAADFDVYEVQNEIDEAVSSLDVKPFQDAVEALRAVRDDGYKVGVISNILLWRSRATRELLSKLDIAGLLDVQIYADDVGSVKPSPRIFEMALTVLVGDIIPDVYVHVGDDFYEDFVGALMADYGSILVDREGRYIKREYHEAVPCRAYIVRDLKMIGVITHQIESCETR
ncbi:HAD-superfamily hydrolase, subfamily IA, variant 1 [Thermoproteus uzoniensis 768-20]|uniref:HAD-superfamily hydrolase, subfamily IA, variant 1 n=1 Tax=Thermoproteus uzoniensis (strain 768-20) TaxID=999630 RepID=F2L2D5_THEU7|nr:HAD family hydrolase [Thermoproteus uzoniensis]AEA11800.1 HAD-superfamily hydrolase, subfamily IA, variant 1 [Thermoproteus uzoniensis 768-20]